MNNSDEKWMDSEPGMDPDSPKDQALLWVSRLATGEADADMLARFERWRDSDPRNEKALNQARQLWLLIGEPLEAQYAPTMASLPARRGGDGGLRRRGRWLAMAAALVMACGLWMQWLLDWRHDQTTATGQQRIVALADGSTMWLNTASAADVQVDARQRHVRLVRGEAYFDVAHAAGLPFTVDAGAGQIRVLGTAFGVRRDGGDVVVTVQRGRVQVSGGGTPAVVVTPDQAVRVHEGDRAKPVQQADAERALAWHTGRLMFENRPVAEVLGELKRYDRRIVIVSYPDSERLRVSSIVDLARIDEWYDTLGQSLPVQVRRIGPFVWIRQSPEVQRTAVHSTDSASSSG